MTVTTLDGIAALRERVGEHLGYSDWLEVTQERVDRFAEATGDHQWIHVDADRAAAGPFGGTIAHGYLTLALGPMLAAQIYAFDGIAMALNYGADRVRFPAPLTVGARVRLGATLTAADEVGGGLQVTMAYVFEVEGGTKPVCVAETLFRIFP